MKSLVDLKRKVIEDVDSFDAQMILWLREVEPIMLGVNLDQLGMTANDQKLSRCFFNCIERYRLCRETARMLKEVERLLKAGDIVAKMGARNYFAKAVEHIPGPSIVNQTTASTNLAKVMDLLNNNDVLRIGVWGMGGVELPDCGICCPKTSSLLLQGNLPLERIPDEFLQAFQSIRVLNLSGTRIQLLPQSILELGELRVLLLRNCICLEELPQLGMLSKLQVLDCCDTRIRKLPNGMENLSNLRQLYLSCTYNLRTIQEGIIYRLSGLEVLDMSLSAYIWAVEQQEGKANATFEELLCLERLLVLSIRLEGIPTLGTGGHTWIGRLRKFQFIIGPDPTTFWQTELYGKRVTLSGLNSLGGMTGLLLTNTTSLVLDCCQVLNEMLTLGIETTGCFAGLKSLTIANSRFWGVSRYYVSKLDLLPNLEELHVLNVKHLESISQLIFHLGLSLSRIRMIEVTKCPQLRFLLSCGNPYLSLKMLEVIKVSFCDRLCELFQHSPRETEDPVSLVPSLRTIQVTNCNALRQFPLRDLNLNTIQEIRGDELWWSKLEDGSDENTKVRLQHCFKPVSANIQPQSYWILSGRFG
ncbi:hypothetical protein LWI29_007851 [Acer saccharum]|uniref:Disease resistance R13L4/SHOC-2-like LRR domain-containing protein n=1 Tax=Acer saccharum TaxID=4024 RepID=A0AA39STU2_ACESA|nr:hypothetical protein LWI29_007851 [Acer saccharum]